MKKEFFIFLIGFLILTSFKLLHPYHVGAVSFEYNSISKRFEVVGTFFMDDLENSVNKNRSSKVFFQRENDKENMHRVLELWSKNNIGLKVDDQVLEFEFVGYEEDKESVNVYLESSEISTPRIVEVGVTALHDIFNDQLNIVHVIVKGKRKSHKLRYPKAYIKERF